MNLVVKMLITLSLIGILVGGLLSQVSSWAEPKIAFHRAEETKAAVFEVIPEAKSFEKIEKNGLEIYKTKKQSDETAGYALVYQGNGFQGKIRLMVGLSENLDRTTGLKILEQLETPGLGAIIVEKSFRDQFNGLEIAGNKLINYFKGKKETKEKNEIQAITGATISSKAVVFIINEGLQKLRDLKAKGEI